MVIVKCQPLFSTLLMRMPQLANENLLRQHSPSSRLSSSESWLVGNYDNAPRDPVPRPILPLPQWYMSQSLFGRCGQIHADLQRDGQMSILPFVGRQTGGWWMQSPCTVGRCVTQIAAYYLLGKLIWMAHLKHHFPINLWYTLREGNLTSFLSDLAPSSASFSFTSFPTSHSPASHDIIMTSPSYPPPLP